MYFECMIPSRHVGGAGPASAARVKRYGGKEWRSKADIGRASDIYTSASVTHVY